jgi:hypothetical protein
MSRGVVKLASTTNIVVATMWQELLTAHGIPCELGGTNMATSVYPMMGQIGAIDVFVREEDATRAREVLEEATGEDVDGEYEDLDEAFGDDEEAADEGDETGP